MDINTAKQLLKKYIGGHSSFVTEALTAERYYRNENDILSKGSRQRTEDSPTRNADERIPSNFHGLQVNQKAAYLFADPPLFDIGSKPMNKKLSELLGDGFAEFCQSLCVNASNCKVGWAHVWRDADGVTQYAAVDPKQIVPVWTDSLKKRLSAVLRQYRDIDGDGKEFDVYEIWTDTECSAFRKSVSSSVGYIRPHMIFDVPDGETTNVHYHDYGEVPFVSFFNNGIETDDLKNIKPLIDCYDKVYSGFLNDLLDVQEVIFVLTNYGGTDLEDFIHEIKKYKAIQIDNEGADDKSGVSTLTIDIPVEAREKLLIMTRKSIFEQGMGIDPDPSNFGNSSGVALSYLYSLLELKAGLMETKFRPAFAQFIRLLCRVEGFEAATVKQTWTRTKVSNDTELADIAQKSVGIISDRTILERHPWVEDVEEEEKRLKEQEEKNAGDSYAIAFPPKIGLDGGADEE